MPTCERRSAAISRPLLRELALVQARAQHPHRLLAVLKLRLLVLHRDHDPGRLVGHPDRGVGRVHRLAAGAGGAVDVDLQVLGGDLDLDLLGLREHRDGRGRGVDPPLRLGLRHPLDAVGAALELEHRVGALAPDLEGDLLEAADLGRRLREHLGLKAALLRVAGEHLEQVAGEQGRLVATRAGADLDDHALVVVRVALDHRQADLLLELAQPFGRLGDQPPQLLVLAVLGEQLLRPLEVAAQLPPRRDQLVRRLELAVLAPDLGVALAVGDHLGIRHLPLELGEPLLDLFGQLLDHVAEATGGVGVGWAL